MYLKKIADIIILLLIFAGASCSSSDRYVGNGIEKTLRKQAETYLASINWSEEIESERLTAPVQLPDGINSAVKLSPVVLNVTSGKTEGIYPYLEGFGSLNVNNMPEGVKKLVKDFASAFCKDEPCDDYMAPDSKYELGLLYQDFAVYFDGKSEKGAFDSFIMGMEFQTSTICAVPLRFNKGKKFVDLTVYCKLCQIEKKDEWLIDSFDIIKSTADPEQNNNGSKGE